MWGGKDQGKGDQVDKYDEKKTQNNLWHIFAFGMFYLGWLLRSSDFVHAVNDYCNLWTVPYFVDNSTFCGQFHILQTVQHFVLRDRLGTRGTKGDDLRCHDMIQEGFEVMVGRRRRLTELILWPRTKRVVVKNISWNHLFSNLFSTTVTFTKFLPKIRASKLP